MKTVEQILKSISKVSLVFVNRTIILISRKKSVVNEKTNNTHNLVEIDHNSATDFRII